MYIYKSFIIRPPAFAGLASPQPPDNCWVRCCESAGGLAEAAGTGATFFLTGEVDSH